MVVLVDDEDRENEGDLVLPAEKITPAAINFMETHARGLICLSLDGQRCERLGLHCAIGPKHREARNGFHRNHRRPSTLRRDHGHVGKGSVHDHSSCHGGRRAASRPASPRAYQPAARAGRRGARPRRANRGLRRSGANGRIQTRGGHLRNQTRRRRDGAAAGTGRIFRAVRLKDVHDRRLDQLPPEARAICPAD